MSSRFNRMFATKTKRKKQMLKFQLSKLSIIQLKPSISIYTKKKKQQFNKMVAVKFKLTYYKFAKIHKILKIYENQIH